MAYGITSESQIIDIDTITSGVNQYKQAVEDFDACGTKVVQASQTCNKDALSVDDASLQGPIESLGNEIKSLKDQLCAVADELLYEARVVHSAQWNELTEYRRQQDLLRQQQQQGQTN